MAKKLRESGVLLVLPDGRYVLQRRDQNTSINTGLLAIFCGTMENDESPVEAAKRELGEETSLNPSSLDFKPMGTFSIIEGAATVDNPAEFNIFLVEIPTSDFQVFEGAGKEIYSYQELKNRTDLAKSAKIAIEAAVR